MSRLLPLIWASLLAACGQTGPLYLPEPGPVIVSPAQDAQGEDEDEDGADGQGEDVQS